MKTATWLWDKIWDWAIVHPFRFILLWTIVNMAIINISVGCAR